MANHGWTITRKKLTPENVSPVIDELNRRVFNNLAIISSMVYKPGCPGWEITISEGQCFLHANCWLETPHHFEVRHRPDPFDFYFDWALLNEIGVEFGGYIRDDGFDERARPTPNEYDDPKAYMKKAFSGLGAIFGRRAFKAGFPPSLVRKLR